MVQMKKMLFPWLAVLLIGVLLLTACSASKTSLSSSAGSSAPGGNNNQALPLAAQLAVGTLKLEGSSNAVDAKEAAELLPLWEAYSQITNSDSAAQAEIDGLVAQIKGTMSPAQISAISAMKLTLQDTFTTMGKLGFAPSSANGSSATSTPRASSSASGGGFAGGAGGPPSGGPAGGGGVPPAGSVGGTDLGGTGFGGLGTGQTSSTQAAPSSTRAGGIPPALLQALIDLLQKRSQS
jgi:hypothetical protein